MGEATAGGPTKPGHQPWRRCSGFSSFAKSNRKALKSFQQGGRGVRFVFRKLTLAAEWKVGRRGRGGCGVTS